VTRSQAVLIAAGIVLFGCIVGALLLRSQYAAISKTDMLGVVPGMTRDQLEKLINVRKWVCAAAADGASIDCSTNAGPLTVAFAPGPGMTPVNRARVRLANRDRLNIDDTAKEITEQYGRAPERRSATSVSWTLLSGMSLLLEQSDAMVLTLFDRGAAPLPR
jgi:hypothetical protein